MDKEKIRKGIRAMGLKQQAVLVRVRVKSTDKEKGTMTGEDLDGAPDFEDISCGMGCIKVMPEKGCTAVIAHIENNEMDSLLLDCEKIEEIIINGGENGGLINIGGLTEKINELVDKFNKHTHAGVITAVAGGSGSPAVGTPGATKKTTQSATKLNTDDYEDKKVLH